MDAAEAIVIEQGASFMTMDAVAAGAGVSKGGLIYHFPSQEAMLSALLERFSNRTKRRREEIKASLPENAASDLVAYILSRSNLCTKARQMGGGLLAAVMRAPQLVKPLQASWKKSMSKMLQSAKNPERMSVLVMAAECIWLLDMLGLQGFTEAELTRIRAEIVKLAYEWSGVEPPPLKNLLKQPVCTENN